MAYNNFYIINASMQKSYLYETFILYILWKIFIRLWRKNKKMLQKEKIIY